MSEDKSTVRVWHRPNMEAQNPIPQISSGSIWLDLLPSEIHVYYMKKLPIYTLTKLAVSFPFWRNLLESNRSAFGKKCIIIPEIECLWASEDHYPAKPRPCNCEDCKARHAFALSKDKDWQDIKLGHPHYKPFKEECECGVCSPRISSNEIDEIISCGFFFNETTTLIEFGYRTQLEVGVLSRLLNHAPLCEELHIGQRHPLEWFISANDGNWANTAFNSHFDITECLTNIDADEWVIDHDSYINVVQSRQPHTKLTSVSVTHYSMSLFLRVARRELNFVNLRDLHLHAGPGDGQIRDFLLSQVENLHQFLPSLQYFCSKHYWSPNVCAMPACLDDDYIAWQSTRKQFGGDVVQLLKIKSLKRINCWGMKPLCKQRRIRAEFMAHMLGGTAVSYTEWDDIYECEREVFIQPYCAHRHTGDNRLIPGNDSLCDNNGAVKTTIEQEIISTCREMGRPFVEVTHDMECGSSLAIPFIWHCGMDHFFGFCDDEDCCSNDQA